MSSSDSGFATFEEAGSIMQERMFPLLETVRIGMNRQLPKQRHDDVAVQDITKTCEGHVGFTAEALDAALSQPSSLGCILYYDTGISIERMRFLEIPLPTWTHPDDRGAGVWYNWPAFSNYTDKATWRLMRLDTGKQVSPHPNRLTGNDLNQEKDHRKILDVNDLFGECDIPGCQLVPTTLRRIVFFQSLHWRLRQRLAWDREQENRNGHHVICPVQLFPGQEMPGYMIYKQAQFYTYPEGNGKTLFSREGSFRDGVHLMEVVNAPPVV